MGRHSLKQPRESVWEKTKKSAANALAKFTAALLTNFLAGLVIELLINGVPPFMS